MNITTATDLMQKKAVKNRLDEFQMILELVEIASGKSIDNIKHRIDTFGSPTLEINIDEWFFEIDGKSFVKWCEENCKGSFNNDKYVIIESLQAI